MMSFYDLPEPDRRRRTELALRERRTLRERWIALEAEGSDRWRRRAAVAAYWLQSAGADSVLDLGCGTMTLERVLPSAIGYVPCDVVRRDARTFVCDLNREPPPKVDADAVACLGVLEYLFNPASLLAILASRHRILITSYNPTDIHPEEAARRANAWINDFSRSELESLFVQAGWMLHRVQRFGPGQFIWLLRSNAEP